VLKSSEGGCITLPPALRMHKAAGTAALWVQAHRGFPLRPALVVERRRLKTSREIYTAFLGLFAPPHIVVRGDV